MSFELLDDEPTPPAKRCVLCGLGNVIIWLLMFIIGWVVIGVLFKICARLFFLGWGLV